MRVVWVIRPDAILDPLCSRLSGYAPAKVVGHRVQHRSRRGGLQPQAEEACATELVLEDHAACDTGGFR